MVVEVVSVMTTETMGAAITPPGEGPMVSRERREETHRPGQARMPIGEIAHRSRPGDGSPVPPADCLAALPPADALLAEHADVCLPSDRRPTAVVYCVSFAPAPAAWVAVYADAVMGLDKGTKMLDKANQLGHYFCEIS